MSPLRLSVPRRRGGLVAAVCVGLLATVAAIGVATARGCLSWKQLDSLTKPPQAIVSDGIAIREGLEISKQLSFKPGGVRGAYLVLPGRAAASPPGLDESTILLTADWTVEADGRPLAHGTAELLDRDPADPSVKLDLFAFDFDPGRTYSLRLVLRRVNVGLLERKATLTVVGPFYGEIR